MLTFLCPLLCIIKSLLWALRPCLLNKKHHILRIKIKCNLPKPSTLCFLCCSPSKFLSSQKNMLLMSVTCVSHRLFALQSLCHEEVLKSFWVSLAKTQRWRQHTRPWQASVSGFPSLIHFTISQDFGLTPAWLLHFLFVWGFLLVQQWYSWAYIATCCLGMQLHIFSHGQSCFFKL